MHYAKVYIEPVAYSCQKMSPFHDAECNTFTDSSDNDKSAGAHVISVSYWKHVQINVFLWQPYTVCKTVVIPKSTDVESLL